MLLSSPGWTSSLPALSSECRARIQGNAPLVELFSKAGLTKLTRRRAADYAGESIFALGQEVLELEQGLRDDCFSPEIKKSVFFLKQLYLKRLGVRANNLGKLEADRLFRGLLVQEKDISDLQKTIAQMKDHDILPIEKYLGKLYGYDLYAMGVEIVGGNANLVDTMLRMLDDVCPPEMSFCGFFDMDVLYKVLLVPQNGMAAYFPDRATLILSQALFESPTLLSKVIFVHELAHVWERSETVRGSNPLEEFSKFSGWKKVGSKLLLVSPPVDRGPRNDTLTELSVGSAFSLLPDGVLVGQGSFDGFVTKRSYETTKERGDVSEDLADHLAILRYAPHRFCFEKKNIASAKTEWLLTRALPRLAKIDCSKAAP